MTSKEKPLDVIPTARGGGGEEAQNESRLTRSQRVSRNLRRRSRRTTANTSLAPGVPFGAASLKSRSCREPEQK